ncbi:MAG: hypothetical protein JO001_04980 [Alphaproteobacteria bacterium]|nr:hypothetical protein [Alphaproteobacteria bacterium]
MAADGNDTRLAAIASERARHVADYDRAMSSFLFEEAQLAQRAIDALDAERAELTSCLPEGVTPLPASEGMIPRLTRPRRRR